MGYCTFPLGQQNRGTVAEVTMSGVESDVYLVDSANLSAFERGTRFRYYGGHYRNSPALLTVPSSGLWTVVVAPSPGGTVRASVRVLASV